MGSMLKPNYSKQFVSILFLTEIEWKSDNWLTARLMKLTPIWADKFYRHYIGQCSNNVITNLDMVMWWHKLSPIVMNGCTLENLTTVWISYFISLPLFIMGRFVVFSCLNCGWLVGASQEKWAKDEAADSYGISIFEILPCSQRRYI